MLLCPFAEGWLGSHKFRSFRPWEGLPESSRIKKMPMYELQCDQFMDLGRIVMVAS